jgi:hypothetical protein
MHTKSDWGVQVLPGTMMKSTFIWIWTHVLICPVVSAINKSLTGGLSVEGAAPPYFGPMGRVSS